MCMACACHMVLGSQWKTLHFLMKICQLCVIRAWAHFHSVLWICIHHPNLNPDLKIYCSLQPNSKCDWRLRGLCSWFSSKKTNMKVVCTSEVVCDCECELISCKCKMYVRVVWYLYIVSKSLFFCCEVNKEGIIPSVIVIYTVYFIWLFFILNISIRHCLFL